MSHHRLPSRDHSPQTDQESGGDNYYISLSDLMVGMLFIFLILLTYFALQSRTYEQENVWLKKLQVSSTSERHALVQASMQNQVLQNRLQQIEERLTDTDRLRSELLLRLQTELKQRGVTTEVDEERGVLRLPQDTLFDAGSAVLRPRGTEAVRQVAEVLEIVLVDTSLSDRLESIFIEGHTDNTPISTSQFRDNLSLSAARAMNTYQALIQSSTGLKLVTNAEKQALFGISGYGELRPIGDNQTPEGRERNRRIDFRFVFSAPKMQPPTSESPASPGAPPP